MTLILASRSNDARFPAPNPLPFPLPVPQFELISYKSEWLSQAEQYKMFQALYQMGVFVSRSTAGFVPLEKMWILSVLQVNMLCTHSPTKNK